MNVVLQKERDFKLKSPNTKKGNNEIFALESATNKDNRISHAPDGKVILFFEDKQLLWGYLQNIYFRLIAEHAELLKFVHWCSV